MHRLIDALDPFPVFLHVDAGASAPMFAELTADLPARVQVLPRLRTGWASAGLAVAELVGYRHALAATDATHVALLSGSDYPLASTEVITRRLSADLDRSLVSFHDLPYERWGLLRGYDRFLFRQRAWRRHRLLDPLPRPWPRDIHPAGGSQMKILSRRHADRLVAVLSRRADLRRYFSTVWIADEVLVPSVLTSPFFSPNWAAEVSGVRAPWFMDWGGVGRQSPRWLQPGDFDAIATAAREDGALFARKFGDDSGALLDRIDAELRAKVPTKATASGAVAR
nr:beta-1,6-N-acetylglucosaminyltransferase [Kineosphaera limosa]